MDERKRPLVLYEYKPVIDFCFDRIGKRVIGEALLQARYCIQYHSVKSLLHCTTDMFNWHYIMYAIGGSNEEGLIIEKKWYHKIAHSEPMLDHELKAHIQFLSSACEGLL